MSVANIEEIYQFTGEITKQALNGFVQMYANTLSRQHYEIKQHVAFDQFNQIRSTIHTIKSNSLYIAAHQLSEHCAELELLIDSNAKLEVLQEKWSATNDEFLLVINYLEGYLANEQH